LSGLAIVAAVIAERCTFGWLIGAGALLGVALAIKQSAFDVLLAVLAWFVLAWVLRWQSRGRVVANAALLSAGVGAVLAGCAWHGSTLGWHNYWYAVAGFRLESRSALSDPEFDKLAISLLFVLPIMLPALILLFRARREIGPRSLVRRPHAALVMLWSATAVASFVTGGSFHRHYFIILAFPLALLAGVAAGKLHSSGERHARVVVALALATAVPLVAIPRLILGDVTDTNVELAAWLDDEEDRRGALVVYAYCADAALYTQIDQLPPFRYLWEDHVRLAEGGQAGVLALVTGRQAPDYVIRLQPLEQCDESGMLAVAIRGNYVSERTIGEAEVLRRIDLPASAG
jgi:hypothetical protein